MAPRLGDREWWTAAECAGYLEITTSTLSTYVKRRQPRSDPIPQPTMIGRTPVWDPDEIREWHARRPGKGWRRDR